MKKLLIRFAILIILTIPFISFIVCFILPINDQIIIEEEPLNITTQQIIATPEPIAMTTENKEEVIIEPTYAYTIANANVRTEPSLKADIVDTLPPAIKVEYIGSIEDEWTSIKVNDNIYYICSECLSIESISAEVALVSLEPTQYQEGEDFIYLEKMENWTFTAYCACEKCCGKWSKYKKTASGTTPEEGRTVACVSLEFGTVVNIYGKDYIVEDTGRLSDTQIDIYFESHQDALEFGRRKGTVYLISEPEEE